LLLRLLLCAEHGSRDVLVRKAARALQVSAAQRAACDTREGAPHSGAGMPAGCGLAPRCCRLGGVHHLRLGGNGLGHLWRSGGYELHLGVGWGGGVGGGALLGGCVSCSPRLPMNACLSAIRGRASSRQPGARRRTRRQRAVAHRGARRVEGDDGEQRRRHHQHQRHAPPPREPARAQHVSNTPPQGRAREAGRARPGARGRTRWYAVARGVRTRAPGARPPPPRASRSHTPKGPPSFG